MIAPQILLLEEFSDSKFIPLIIFGAVTLLGGVLTFILPETRGVKLPDTIDDAEKFNDKQIKDRKDKLNHERTAESIRL